MMGMRFDSPLASTIHFLLAVNRYLKKRNFWLSTKVEIVKYVNMIDVLTI